MTRPLTADDPRPAPDAGPSEAAEDRVRRLKRAFGAYPTGVTVVTTMAGGAPLGFTANSFTSVSIDPPLLLVCHGNAATSAPAFQGAEGFAVNVLAADQDALAMRFASRIDDRFGGVDWSKGRGGPLLSGTAAWFDCAMHAVHDAGDHAILVGHVLDHGVEERASLLYAGGKFQAAP